MRLSNSTFALVFTALYVIALAVFMQYHELWFDETEPWLLALYSNSYSDLLYNKRYEGHPNLWYSLLFFITRFTHDLRALQISQFAFAVSFVYVFLRYAPFHWSIRLLFCFGYYGLFEYGVISRLYAMELFTLFLACALYPKRFSHWYLYIFVLALNAHTHLFGLMLSGVLGALLFSEALGLWKQIPHKVTLSPVKFWSGVGMLGFAGLLSLWTIARPEEFGEANTHYYYLLQALTRPWQAFFPVPEFKVQFWNTSLLRTTYEVPLSILLVGLVTYMLRYTKQILWSVLTAFLLLFLFFYLKYEGAMRHYAHFFLFTLAISWILFYYRSFSERYNTAYKRLKVLVVVALTIQFLIGIYAVYTDINYSFHPAKEAAQYIQKEISPQAIVTVQHHAFASSIMAYLGKPLLHLPELKPKTFFVMGGSLSRDMTYYQELDWARALAQREQRSVVFVSMKDINHYWYPYPVKKLASFAGANKYMMNYYFYLYQVEPMPLPTTDFVAGTPASAIP